MLFWISFHTVDRSPLLVNQTDLNLHTVCRTHVHTWTGLDPLKPPCTLDSWIRWEMKKTFRYYCASHTVIWLYLRQHLIYKQRNYSPEFRNLLVWRFLSILLWKINSLKTSPSYTINTTWCRIHNWICDCWKTLIYILHESSLLLLDQGFSLKKLSIVCQYLLRPHNCFPINLFYDIIPKSLPLCSRAN